MKKNFIIISSVIACVILYIIEQVIMVDYITKTLLKIIFFTLIPYIYIKFIKKSNFKKSLNYRSTNKGDFKLGLLFGIISFSIILITYYFTRHLIDLQGIAIELQNKSKITPTTFIFIGVYITLGNSFLEEYFFRGFIFLNLYEENYKVSAYVFSSLLFGLYHIAIFRTWFNIWLIALALIGLISVGFIFNWLNTKSRNFVNSWLVHIFADSAIILIGLRMFGTI